MSNYRRLISYIYAYEGGVKGKNIGYAKVEVRNGQCRIYVNVKKVYVGRNDIGVYLLAPAGEILLGRIFIRGGNGEFRITVMADNIDGKEISIDQCYGLTVHDAESAWQSYTTIWEDAVAQAAEVELANVTAENIRRQRQEKKQDQKQETTAEEEWDGAAEPETEKMPVYDFPVSREIEQELEQEERRLQDVTPWDDEPTQTIDHAEASLPVLTPQEVAAPDTDSPAPTTSCAETPSPTSAAPDLEDPVKLAELDRQEMESARPNQFWNQMQQRYARVLAFDYDKGCEILSIKPQDIGLLPRETWVYGNNSFLLHGYYNYRHLILARLNNPQGEPRYLLGVPGHYFSNEKYMAAMFGFPHFVIARKQPEEDGRFGYWYTDIKL